MVESHYVTADTTLATLTTLFAALFHGRRAERQKRPKIAGVKNSIELTSGWITEFTKPQWILRVTDRHNMQMNVY